MSNLRLHAVHRGVFAIGHDVLDQRDYMVAAALAVGPGAAVSGRAGIHLWGVTRVHWGAIRVVTNKRFRGAVGNVHVSQSQELGEGDIRRRHGVPVTSLPWTMLELGDEMEPHDLAHVLHEAAYQNLLDLDGLHTIAARLHGRHAASVLLEAVELHVTGSAGFRSQLERKFFAAVRTAKLPVPKVNTKLAVPAEQSLGSSTFELDFYWPDYRLCVETDGPGHTRPEVVRKDAQRDRQLRAAGYTVIRCVGAAQIADTIRKIEPMMTFGTKTQSDRQISPT